MNQVGIKIENFLDQNNACVVITQLPGIPARHMRSNKNKNLFATINS